MRMILFNKPYGCLSQFSDKDGRETLAQWITAKAVYPAGRLDFHSEGMLILTDHGKLQEHITDPKYKLAKTYRVQVEGNPSSEACAALCSGVHIKNTRVRALSVRLIDEPADLWSRTPAVRYRKSVPDHWLELVIDRGLNRQVRRMTAAVGLPTLRLIRTRVGPWSLDTLQPGQFRELEAPELDRDLRSLGWRLT